MPGDYVSSLLPSLVAPLFVHLASLLLFSSEDLPRHLQVVSVLQTELQDGSLLLFQHFPLVSAESLFGFTVCLLCLLKFVKDSGVALFFLKTLDHLLLILKQKVQVSVSTLELPSER